MARLVVVNTKNYKAIAYLLAIPILTVGGITIISVFNQKSKSRANLPKNDNPKKLRKTYHEGEQEHQEFNSIFGCWDCCLPKFK